MELPKRKHPRLKEYDYSQNGYYYITIHTQDENTILSRVGRGLAPAVVSLTEIGKIAQNQLLALKNRFPFVRIDKYVIMPTHIHAIVVFEGETVGADPRPTLSDVVCAYKSVTTRECNQKFGTSGMKRFQTSFYETVLRNEKAYQQCWRYIDENPLKWSIQPEDR